MALPNQKNCGNESNSGCLRDPGLSLSYINQFFPNPYVVTKCSSLTTSIKAHFSCIDPSKKANEVTNVTSSSQGMEFNIVDYVVWLLHRSSRSFSQAINSLGLARSGPALAMAWIGKNVYEWHRRITYKVAVYALIKVAIDLEILLSHERINELSLVKEM
ncbi:hypothetical protein Fmac_020884 [Flemingia macrophylla]|uniref:Uncharacterized protein n=1 Tax=Flemingia macrophylla TaxID=520843 RepID=A0ABD1LVA9_9FABA